MSFSPKPLNRLDNLFGLLSASAVGDGDIEAGAGEFESDSAADAFGGSGHESYFGSGHGGSLANPLRGTKDCPPRALRALSFAASRWE